MLPLADNNPTRSLPIVTILLIALNVVAFAGQMLSPYGFEWSIAHYGLIPAHLMGLETLPDQGAPPDAATLFTSMFLHGSLMHIGGNMLYLWIFGDNIENDLGPIKYLFLYIISGLAAAAAQIATGPGSLIPMVGASGAISGVLGAYLLLHPNQKITVLIPRAGLTHMPAFAVLGLWFVYQLAYGLLSNPAEGGVAFWAHVGGFVAGVVLVMLLRPRQTQH